MRRNFAGREISPCLRSAAHLNGKQFNLDVPCFVPEVDHGTVAIHCRAGIDDLYAIDFHDAPGLVDVSTAHDVKRLHVFPDAVYNIQSDALSYLCILSAP